MNHTIEPKPARKGLSPLAARVLGTVSTIVGFVFMLGFILPYIGPAIAILGILLFFVGISLFAASSRAVIR